MLKKTAIVIEDIEKFTGKIEKEFGVDHQMLMRFMNRLYREGTIDLVLRNCNVHQLKGVKINEAQETAPQELQGDSEF